MNKIASLSFAIVSLFCIAVQAADVKITAENGVRRIRTPKYEATIAADGCLTNLKIDGQEFFASDVSRGSYFHRKTGPLNLPDIAQPSEAVVTAKSAEASVQYGFTADAITFDLDNLTPEALDFIMVLDAGVGAMLDEKGEWHKLPLARGGGSKTVWFRGKSRLEITANVGIWGPYKADTQVVQTRVLPGKSNRMTFKIDSASEAEATKLETLLPPPPKTKVEASSVRLPAVFASHMVLQQGVAVPVWGWADDGAVVTVEFGGQKVSTTAQNGNWSLKLGQLSASSQPQTFTVSSKTTTLQLTNVLVGEVWVCSGQSNMEWPLGAAFEGANDVATATNSLIRLLHVPKTRNRKPQTDVNAKWAVCSPDAARNFSAVGYYFGRDLQAARNVPVGLIKSDWGGSPAQAWMGNEFLAASPRWAKEIIKPSDEAVKKYPAVLEEFQKRKALAAQENKTFIEKEPHRPWEASELYNGMIAPLLPFAIKGAIWYQGEANSGGAAWQYRSLFADLIRNWRADWKQGDFTFLCVQLAPWDNFRKRSLEDILKIPSEDGVFPKVREAQLLATKILPKVGMAVITDVGDQEDIHPKKKQPVGARLALAARAIAYGEQIEFSGPIYRSMKVDGGKIILSFDHVGKGLAARDGELKGFAICGADKKFVWAKAEIVGDTVVVSSPEVSAPVAARYAWADFPVVNFWNKDGLPASPFRTDDPDAVSAPPADSGKN